MIEYKGRSEEGYSRRYCVKCKNNYKPTAPNQKYCKSCWRWNKYRINNLSRRKPKRALVCIECKKEFFSSRQQKFCGSVCRKIGERKSSKIYYKNVIKPNKHLDRSKSFPQKYVFTILKNYFNDLTWTYNNRSVIKNPKTGYPLELDIWCPDKRVAIEYDGEHHFSPKQYGKRKLSYVQNLDKTKNYVCKNNNIKLLRLSKNDKWRDKEWLVKKVGVLLNEDC